MEREQAEERKKRKVENEKKSEVVVPVRSVALMSASNVIVI